MSGKKTKCYQMFMGYLMEETATGFMLHDLVPALEFVRSKKDPTKYRVMATGITYRPISSYREGFGLRESSAWTDINGELQPHWEADLRESDWEGHFSLEDLYPKKQKGG